MPAKPFLSRLIVPFGGMIALVVVICGVVIYQASQQAAHQQQIDELARLAKLVREQFPEDLSSQSEQNRTQLRNLADLLATRVTLIDARGNVAFDTQADASTMENHNGRPEIIDARRGTTGSSVRFSHTLNEQAVYVAQPLDPSKPTGMILRLSYPQRVWAKLIVPAWAIVLSAVLSATLLIAWLTRVLQRDWIGPVRTLSHAAGRMAAGQWQTRVAPRGADEIRDFSTRLNHLAAEAEKQLADLDARRSELQALVDSLPDPILLTDAQQRVALINLPAARLLQLSPTQALGKKLVGVLNDESLVALFDTASTSSTDAASPPQEIRLARGGQRLTYQAVATRTRSGGVLLVLRNVTALVSTVQMKTDFVANASHELRTPIAAIKIAFETLQEVYTEDPQQTARCVTIVSGHLKRLEEMLGDLLDLSRVETPDLKPDLGTIRTDELFAMVRGAMLSMARQKIVELAFERAGGAPDEFASDKRLLNLILRNLVENAIKFTPTGGKVTVSVAPDPEDASAVLLRVIDTGIGIPAEHLERVFERFYQVDAARSGAAGRGTGLGLAIVKHAINGLGGTVQIESQVGVGTTVTCRLPQNENSQTATAAL